MLEAPTTTTISSMWKERVESGEERHGFNMLLFDCRLNWNWLEVREKAEFFRQAARKKVAWENGETVVQQTEIIHTTPYRTP